LIPPWLEVKTQRQQTLWFSQEKKIYERTFVGFDYLYSDAKAQAIQQPGPRSSGDYFDVMEYRIWWPMLVGEWVIIGFATICLCVVLSRRRQVGPQPPEVEVKPGDSSDRVE